MKWRNELQVGSTLLRNKTFFHDPAAEWIRGCTIQMWQPIVPEVNVKKNKTNFDVIPSSLKSEVVLSRIVTGCSLSIFSVGLMNCTGRHYAGKTDFAPAYLANSYRNIYQCCTSFAPSSGKPSSKLEESVHALKEKAKEKLIESPPTDKEINKKKEKKPIMQRIKAELLHYYYGFKLLFVNAKVCSKFVLKTLSGNKLSRRERKLMVTTLGDLFRLVPFSVFIIVPFLEFTLPIFLKFFPGMLPSTFETKSQKENKMKKKFQIQLDMTSFLQSTLQNMSVGGKGHESEEALKFTEFFEKVRSSGGVVTSDEVMKFSKMFRDEITLDNLSRAQLKALCKVLGLKPIGTTKFLRFQLGLKLRSLQADDKLIQKEGVNSLTVEELQLDCQARGMPAWGVSEERLKQQLSQWLTLSVEKKVPPSLLLLSQAFMFPSNTPTEEKLAATIQSLPEGVVTATKAEIEVREGKIDFKTRLDQVNEELEQISKELKEIDEEKRKMKVEKEASKQILGGSEERATRKLDQPSSMPVKAPPQEEVVNPDEINALKSVLNRKLRFEKEKLAEIMHLMENYEQDSKELEQMLSTLSDADIKESSAAKHLKKKLKKIISNLNENLSQMEPGYKNVKDMKTKEEALKAPRTELIKIEEFVEALNRLPGKASLNHERLIEILHRLDKNKDGYVSADLVVKMIDILGYEGVNLSKKQVDELVDLLDKEEILEIDHQILKALTKDDAVSELKKELEKRRTEIIEELKKEKKESDLKRKEEENKIKLEGTKT